MCFSHVECLPLQKLKAMHKQVLLLTFILSLFFCSCDAPPVGNKGVQKELSNRKVRHISHEDEELFGLIYSEQIISEITIDSINQQMIDSLNKIKGFSFEYINNKNIDQQPQVIGEQMEMFTYNLVRGLDLEANEITLTQKKTHTIMLPKQ